jgi:threonine dehydrogenase-like Zn-dependent dehydrogenase
LLKAAYCGVCGSDVPRIITDAAHYYPIILGHEFSGYDFVIEAAGAPAAEILALKLAAPKATVMFVGTPHSALTLQPAEFELINRKELTLQGSWLNYSAPFPGWEWQYGLEMLTKRQVDIEPLVGSTLPLSQADRLPALLSERGGLKRKIVLDCSS